MSKRVFSWILIAAGVFALPLYAAHDHENSDEVHGSDDDDLYDRNRDLQEEEGFNKYDYPDQNQKVCDCEQNQNQGQKRHVPQYYYNR